LEKGSNYVQLIPEILARFREKKIGIVSDIRKAFQMIEVQPGDRDAMRFAWWKNYEKRELMEYRHVRVMFGATCSPFVLGAVLEYHLNNVKQQDKQVASKLLEAMYVDNCVSSEDTFGEYADFRENSIRILQEAQMDLRMWMSNVEEVDDPATRITSVIGIMWDRKEDCLYADAVSIPTPTEVTKRTILSSVQKIFDPKGFFVSSSNSNESHTAVHMGE
jgi:hypothetical protein